MDITAVHYCSDLSSPSVKLNLHNIHNLSTRHAVIGLLMHMQQVWAQEQSYATLIKDSLATVEEVVGSIRHRTKS